MGVSCQLATAKSMVPYIVAIGFLVCRNISSVQSILRTISWMAGSWVSSSLHVALQFSSIVEAIPKGPFRTKNTTMITKMVNYYAVVFSLRPPNLLRRGPFFERKNVCNSQENGVRTRRAAIVNHPAILKVLRVVNLLRIVFLVRRGPLGMMHILKVARVHIGSPGKAQIRDVSSKKVDCVCFIAENPHEVPDGVDVANPKEPLTPKLFILIQLE